MLPMVREVVRTNANVCLKGNLNIVQLTMRQPLLQSIIVISVDSKNRDAT